MGTDIHAYVEAENYNRFYLWARISLSRNYSMFQLMAGVRDGDALFAPRGFPADAYAITCLDYQQMGADAHTASWLTADEFEQVLRAYDANGEWGTIPPIYTATLAMMRALGDTARLVFWFDS